MSREMDSMKHAFVAFSQLFDCDFLSQCHVLHVCVHLKGQASL